MNIGIVTTWFECGAGYVSKSYERILGTKHKIFIYARGGMAANSEVWCRSNVSPAPAHWCSTGIHEKHFLKWIRQNSIEIVLFNEQRHWAGVLSAIRSGVVVGGYVDYYTADTAPFFDVYDFLICNTKRHYNVFKHHPQVCYCPWGTQTDLYKPPKKITSRPTTFIISAGWDGAYASANDWMDRRGAGLAMRVFSRVKGDCRLVILSQVPLANCPEEWQVLVAQDPRIEFRVGTFNPVPYCDGDVYVYPSRLDGIGLTLPEALSSGLPAITTNSPPMNEFVSHMKNGILVDVQEFRGRPDGYYWPEAICSENSLANAYSYYISNPEMVIAHGEAARATAETDLEWTQNASFLCDWVPNQQKRIHSKSELMTLSGRITKYDRGHNPTPMQRILTGVKAYVVYATNRIKRTGL